MVNSANPNKTALTSIFIYFVCKGIVVGISIFWHMKKKRSFQHTAPAEMVCTQCTGAQQNILNDGLKITLYVLHPYL